MNREKWLALAAKCETATGPDREIDFSIGFATGWRKDIIDGNDMVLDWDCNAYPNHYGSLLPSATESLDAITALIERVLPGWMVRAQWCNVSAEAWVAPDLNSPDCPPDIAADPARWHDYCERNEVEIRPGSRDAAIRALCAAFCRAMSEKAG